MLIVCANQTTPSWVLLARNAFTLLNHANALLTIQSNRELLTKVITFRSKLRAEPRDRRNRFCYLWSSVFLLSLFNRLSRSPQHHLRSPGVLTICMKKTSIPIGKSYGSRHFRFGKLQKIIVVSWDHEILLLFLVCWADLDMLCISGRSPTASNFLVLCLCTRNPPEWQVLMLSNPDRTQYRHF